MQGRVQLWGHQIAVDWAEPELEVPEEVMAQVRHLGVGVGRMRHSAVKHTSITLPWLVQIGPLLQEYHISPL